MECIGLQIYIFEMLINIYTCILMVRSREEYVLLPFLWKQILSKGSREIFDKTVKYSEIYNFPKEHSLLESPY